MLRVSAWLMTVLRGSSLRVLQRLLSLEDVSCDAVEVVCEPELVVVLLLVGPELAVVLLLVEPELAVPLPLLVEPVPAVLPVLPVLVVEPELVASQAPL